MLGVTHNQYHNYIHGYIIRKDNTLYDKNYLILTQPCKNAKQN